MSFRLRLLSFVFVAFYLIFIIFSIEHVCSIFSGVEGYQCANNSYAAYAFGAFLLLLLGFSIPILGRSYSACLLWLMYYFHVAPSILIFSRLSAASFEEFIIFSLMVFLSYLILVYVARLKIPKIGLVYFKSGLNHWLLFFVACFFVFVVINGLGFNFNPPSIDDVYDLRAEYKEKVTPLVGYIAVLIGYFLSPVFIVLSVILFGSGHNKRAVLFLCSAVFLSYLIYSSAGFKSVAFMPVVTLLACLLFRRVENIGFSLNCLFLLLLVMAWVGYVFFDFSILLEHWVRRALIVPGMTVAYFYDYSVVYGFSADVAAPNVISKMYFGTDGSANAGFIGDGIARFGISLFWINILLLLIFVKLPELLLGSLEGPYVPALFISTAYALSNSSITTVFLTYGFLPLLIFLYFYKRILVK